MSAEDFRRAAESHALIGRPEEIIKRLEQLRAGGVERIMAIDVGGSLPALRTFAQEIIPEFTDRACVIAATADRSRVVNSALLSYRLIGAMTPPQDRDALKISRK